MKYSSREEREKRNGEETDGLISYEKGTDGGMEGLKRRLYIEEDAGRGVKTNDRWMNVYVVDIKGKG